jgi:hypothetical protein
MRKGVMYLMWVMPYHEARHNETGLRLIRRPSIYHKRFVQKKKIANKV